MKGNLKQIKCFKVRTELIKTVEENIKNISGRLF